MTRIPRLVGALVILASVGVSHVALAKDDEKFDENIRVERADRAIVEVLGVACSFCAYGTEKNLARLEFVNPVEEEFGGDGVLLDVKTGLITLALRHDKRVEFADIARAIEKGGYTPVAIHVELVGTVVRREDTLLLELPETAGESQLFPLYALNGAPWDDDALLDQAGTVQGVVSVSSLGIDKKKVSEAADAEVDVLVKSIEKEMES